jgi:hypothetical protein
MKVSDLSGLIFRSGLLLAILLAALVPAVAQSPEEVLGFEVEGPWRTAPDLLSQFAPEELFALEQTTVEELAAGFKLTTDLVKQGQSAGRWSNLPRYPTLHTTAVPRDWSAVKTLTLWVHSAQATGDLITVGVLSDSPATPYRDFYLREFKVNWQGWRQLALPLEEFTAYGQPAGLKTVGGLFFFARFADRAINPYTVLTLDDLQLETRARSARPRLEPAAAAPAGRLPLTTQLPAFEPALMNHPYPETTDNQRVSAPIKYRAYFLAERALHGYFPRFQPGFVSFSPTGQPFIQYGTHILQTLGPDGQWTWQDLLPEVLEPFCRDKLGITALSLLNTGQGNEATIRFDAQGDAYMLALVQQTKGDWNTRHCLLLHSRDRMQTWDVHVLPSFFARFEKLTGNNPDALKQPPVVLLSRFHAPATISLLTPEKGPDGRLKLPEPVKIAEQAIPFLPHSGEANQALSHGDKVIITYSLLKELPGKTKEDGVPAFAIEYDRLTKKLSAPVLIGFGGKNAVDDHNWTSLAADSKGVLHVLINGHHDPFRYVHSLAPWDISRWSEPVSVGGGTSYAGLVCDDQDTLYSVTRNAEVGYYFRLSLHRKKAGQPWEKPVDLVSPFKPYYKVWFHKLVIDPATQRLYLAYHSQCPAPSLFMDEYLAFINLWPHYERPFQGETGAPRLPLGADRSRAKPRKYEYYSPPPSEMSILVSEDRGNTWHLATSEDFRAPAGAANLIRLSTPAP